MKIKIILLLSLLSFFGCKESEENSTILELSESTFKNINSSKTTLKISITSNASWTVSSGARWCSSNIQSGTNNGEITLTVEANLETKERNATIIIQSGKIGRTISVSQKAYNGTEEYHYQLPVIFHVLYNNKNDRYQYVEKAQLEKIIKLCNSLYRNELYTNDAKNISQNINLEFVMATQDPDGKLLEEPGIRRVEWSSPTMDCEKFMREKNTTNMNVIWNPNQYINIVLYAFTNANILGISHLPYAPSSNPLPGLNNGDYYLTHSTQYPHCVSINNKYIYDLSGPYYKATDAFVTLAHELGHYLGLHHAFSEEGENTDLCKDTDYCDDTPTYNITDYNTWIKNLPKDPKYTLGYLSTKQNCAGEEFVSHNLMDYAYCLSDQFTQDQRSRIRHVLTYSPLTPGPKKSKQSDTRSIFNDIEPPIQVLK